MAKLYYVVSAFLKVIVSPEDVNVSHVGQNFLFPCVALSSEDDIDISWLHDGRPVVSNSFGALQIHPVTTMVRGNFTIKTSVLEVCVSGLEQTGNYSCRVSLHQESQEYAFHVNGEPH